MISRKTFVSKVLIAGVAGLSAGLASGQSLEVPEGETVQKFALTVPFLDAGRQQSAAIELFLDQNADIVGAQSAALFQFNTSRDVVICRVKNGVRMCKCFAGPCSRNNGTVSDDPTTLVQLELPENLLSEVRPVSLQPLHPVDLNLDGMGRARIFVDDGGALAGVDQTAGAFATIDTGQPAMTSALSCLQYCPDDNHQNCVTYGLCTPEGGDPAADTFARIKPDRVQENGQSRLDYLIQTPDAVQPMLRLEGLPYDPASNRVLFDGVAQ